MKLLLSLIMLVLSSFTQAYAEPYVVVTSTNPLSWNPGNNFDTEVYFTINDWSANDTMPTGCIRGVQCSLGYVIYPDDSLAYGFGDSPYVNVTAYGKFTMGDLFPLFQKKYGYSMPISKMTRMDSKDLGKSCLGLIMGNLAAKVSNCARIRSAAVRCDITGNTTIDHKMLLDSALNGAQASTQLNLKCDSSASVTVKATRTNSYGVRLRSDDSLYSEVKINSQDATNGINLSVQNNLSSPIYITSTLITRGTVAAGAFSGSTVITVEPN